MRFITEFELTEEDKKNDNWLEFTLAKQKYNRQVEMGTMLADSFGWQNPVNDNPLRHRLEIEAFPMDKWIEFKNLMWEALTNDNIDLVQMLQAIKELESFGKPAGAAKEL